jgi:hypothetical protein
MGSIRGVDDQQFHFNCARETKAMDELIKEILALREAVLWGEIVAENPDTTKVCHKPGCKSVDMITYPSQNEKQCVKCSHVGKWTKDEGQEGYY